MTTYKNTEAALREALEHDGFPAAFAACHDGWADSKGAMDGYLRDAASLVGELGTLSTEEAS